LLIGYLFEDSLELDIIRIETSAFTDHFELQQGGCKIENRDVDRKACLFLDLQFEHLSFAENIKQLDVARKQNGDINITLLRESRRSCRAEEISKSEGILRSKLRKKVP